MALYMSSVYASRMGFDYSAISCSRSAEAYRGALNAHSLKQDSPLALPVSLRLHRPLPLPIPLPLPLPLPLMPHLELLEHLRLFLSVPRPRARVGVRSGIGNGSGDESGDGLGDGSVVGLLRLGVGLLRLGVGVK